METGMQKLQNKLLARFLLVVSIPMLIGTLASLEIIRRQLHVDLQERLGHSVEGVKLEIEQTQAKLYMGVKALSGEKELRAAYQSEDLQQILRELIQAKTIMGIDCATAVGADGTVLARAHEPGRFGDALATDDVGVRVLQGQEYVGMAAGERGIVIEVALPVYTGTSPDLGGVLKVGKLLDYAFLDRLKTKFGLELMLYNSQRLQGTTFIDTDVLVDTDHAALHQRVRTHKQRVDMELWLGRQEYFITAIPLQSQQKQVLGTLLLALSQETVRQTATYLSLVSGLVGLCLILATAIVCYRVSLNIVRPVQTLSAMACKVAKGDMAQRVQVLSRDEIGQLAISLNEMAEELQRTTTSIDTLNQEIDTRKHAESKLACANQQLTASEQQLQASNQQLRVNEQQLRREKYRVQSYLDVAGIMLLVIDSEQRVDLINKQGCKILGYDESEVLGKNWFETFLPERLRHPTKAVFERLVAGEIEPTEYYENPVVTRDGSERLISWHNTVVRNDEGQIICTLSSGEDITERKQAEETLKESEERLKILFEWAPDAYYIHDLEGKLVDGNRAAEELVGYQKGEATGKSFFELGIVTETDVPKIIAAVADNRDGKPAGPLELTFKRKDGSKAVVETRSYPVDINGETLILGIARDITERKQAESELECANYQLTASEQQLRAYNQQLMASEQQLRAYSQQLTASEQQLQSANQQLRASEEKYRQLFETEMDAIMIFDAETRAFLDINDAAICLYGYRREEFLNLIQTDISIEEEASDTSIKQTATGQPARIPLQHHKKKDGTVFPVEISGGSFMLDGRKVICGVIRDITERKQAEEALHRERRLNEELFKTTPAFAVAINAEGKTVMMNDAMCHALGYTFNEVDGTDYLTTFVPAREREMLAGVFEKLVATRESTVSENLLLTRDGRELLVEWQGSQIFNANGGFEFLFGVGIDITEHKKAQNALRESEARFRTLFEQAAVGVALIVTETGQFLRLNQKYCDIVGYSQEEMETLSFQKITHPADLQADLDNMEKLKHGQIHEFSMEKRYFRKDGSLVWVNLTVSPMWRVGEKPHYHIAVVEDITERKQAQERLTSHQERLRSMASELSLTEEHERRKMAGYLHDGPCQELAACLLKLESLRASSETVNERPVAEVCQMIHHTVQELRDLTFDLSPPTLYLVGLEAALEELLKEKLRDRHHIPYNFKRANISQLLGDDLRALLFQSVRELLNNIVKYAHAQMVNVAISRDDNGIKLTVNDDGIGFDINTVGSAVSKTGGYGLFNMGERIAYVGGQFEIWSQPGQGSRFTITIPLEMKE
jgi:PAS domain S-box-containing protein